MLDSTFPEPPEYELPAAEVAIAIAPDVKHAVANASSPSSAGITTAPAPPVEPIKAVPAKAVPTNEMANVPIIKTVLVGSNSDKTSDLYLH